MGSFPTPALPPPSNLSKDDLELLLELKEASQYFPDNHPCDAGVAGPWVPDGHGCLASEARDILQPGINRSGYVEEILNNRGPAGLSVPIRTPEFGLVFLVGAFVCIFLCPPPLLFPSTSPSSLLCMCVTTSAFLFPPAMLLFFVRRTSVFGTVC